MIRSQPAASSGSNRRASHSISPLELSCCTPATAWGATTRMEAPQRSRLSTFSRPIKPAPTTRHLFPSSFRNKGKRLALSLKVSTPDRGGIPEYRLERFAGKLLAQLLVAGPGKVSAQVFPGLAGLQIPA